MLHSASHFIFLCSALSIRLLVWLSVFSASSAAHTPAQLRLAPTLRFSSFMGFLLPTLCTLCFVCSSQSLLDCLSPIFRDDKLPVPVFCAACNSAIQRLC